MNEKFCVLFFQIIKDIINRISAKYKMEPTVTRLIAAEKKVNEMVKVAQDKK